MCVCTHPKHLDLHGEAPVGTEQLLTAQLGLFELRLELRLQLARTHLELVQLLASLLQPATTHEECGEVREVKAETILLSGPSDGRFDVTSFGPAGSESACGAGDS